jgi:hypothetical protein
MHAYGRMHVGVGAEVAETAILRRLVGPFPTALNHTPNLRA